MLAGYQQQDDVFRGPKLKRYLPRRPCFCLFRDHIRCLEITPVSQIQPRGCTASCEPGKALHVSCDLRLCRF